MVDAILEVEKLAKFLPEKGQTSLSHADVTSCKKRITFSPGKGLVSLASLAAGKSTLARVMVYLHAPDRGTVQLEGKLLRDMPAPDLIELYNMSFKTQ